MQINLNFEGDLHVDSNNLGESHICTFGRYEKGALLVESDAGTEQREETLSFETYETLLNRVQHGIIIIIIICIHHLHHHHHHLHS